MPKVLIITYYWPPAGGSGVQRWLKFAKYLRDFGWEPVIYTALNPEAPDYDNELLKEVPEGIEVIKKSVWEPYSIFRKITGTKDQKFGAGLATQGKSKKNFINRFAIWARGNIFIPDARMFWIRPSAKFLSKYLKENPVNVIVSTGPPHSTHLIAKKLNKKLNIPWVADFRDPWTGIYYFDLLMPTGLTKAIHGKLESGVFKTADQIVTVSSGCKKGFENLGAKQIEVIENGFDEADYPDENLPLDHDFTITHLGTLPPQANCLELWRSIDNMLKKNTEFASKLKLKFVGTIDASVTQSLKESNIFEYCEFVGYLSHSETIKIQRRSQVLLLLVANSPSGMGILTGKVFEYLAAQRPILAVGPIGGNTQELIESTNSGIFLPFGDADKIEEGIEKLWEWYKNSWSGFTPSGIERYSRRELTRRMALLFDRITNEQKK